MTSSLRRFCNHTTIQKACQEPLQSITRLSAAFPAAEPCSTTSLANSALIEKSDGRRTYAGIRSLCSLVACFNSSQHCKSQQQQHQLLQTSSSFATSLLCNHPLPKTRITVQEFARNFSTAPPPSSAPSQGAFTSVDGPSAAVLEADRILQHVAVAEFREELAALSQDKAALTYSELLQRCQQSGAGRSAEEAEAVCEALCRAGVVMRYRNLVYLRPDEIASHILESLPDSEKEYTAMLEELQQQIEPLERQKSDIDTYAARRIRLVLWGGLGVMLAQFSLFYWLTFHELSWDVMEPVAYFVGLGTGIGYYLYFLSTSEPFDYGPLRRRLFTRWQENAVRVYNFDMDRYAKLQRDMQRYNRYLKHMKKA